MGVASRVAKTVKEIPEKLSAKEQFMEKRKKELKEEYPEKEPVKSKKKPFENSSDRLLRENREGQEMAKGGLVTGTRSNPLNKFYGK